MNGNRDRLHTPGADAQEIMATLERIVFHNEDNGYTVLRAMPQKNPDSAGGKTALDEIVCVGHMLSPKQGSLLKLHGRFVNSPRWGRQFMFDAVEESMPAASEDIRAYLASGVIKGIGAEYARRIVSLFGDKTIEILDNNPESLLRVPGIGPKSLERIRQSWDEHRGMRNLHLFLQPYGVGAAHAVRIYKAYGDEAVQIVRTNPYRLAMDIRGIGFLTADAIATKMGFSENHPLRVQAAVLYALQKASDDGHVFLPQEILEKYVNRQIGVEAVEVEKAVLQLEQDDRIVCEFLQAGKENSFNAVYLKRFYHCESQIAFYLKRLLHSPKSVIFKNPEQTLQHVLAELPITLAELQIKAVETSMREKALVITGGPGTGKTTIIKSIIKLFEQTGTKILLAAPTGRAAKRMAEAAGRDAKTIHRLLEYSPREDRFCRDEDNPLSCGLLVVDEASMIDTLLFYRLLKAIPLGATFIIVGDANQLPSVGPGNVLADITGSGAVPVVELNEIFRQSAVSDIVCNAHLINHGQMPILANNVNRKSDFYFIGRNDPDEAADLIVDLIKNQIPCRFGFDPVNEIQLLTPMHKGAVGAENMNKRLQAALNPNGLEIKRGESSFRLQDKVMQIKNNYEKDIFNGDIGRIVHIDVHEKKLSVNFDGMVMPYDFDELDELIPAYAISIHKSQGSEYPAVVIPVMMQHYVLLQRNLVYTGVTRGKQLVVLVGEKRALRIAINNNGTSRRYTWLAHRLS